MAVKPKKNDNGKTEENKWPYGTKNYIIFATAIIVIIIGFVTLGQGSITLAPFLLVVGYCILLPIALIIKDKPEENTQNNSPDIQS